MWSRPLLTGTASKTEFIATHSKQTTEEFLTGARTAIRETAKHQESFGDSKLNRQIAELKHTVSHRKQSAINCANRQKIQKRPHPFFVRFSNPGELLSPAHLHPAPQPQDFPE